MSTVFPLASATMVLSALPSENQAIAKAAMQMDRW